MTYSAIAAIAAVLGGCGDGSQQSQAAGHVCDRPFDSQAWFASKQGPERQRLAKRLVHCRDLIGKSKREVARVIGKPPRVEGTTKREYSRRWTYELGENDLIPPDSTTLEVVFDAHGKVRRVEWLLDGQAAEAAQCALEATEFFRPAGTRIDEARARVLAGRALGEAGERDRGIAELTGARDVLERCGAKRFRDEADQHLRALGMSVYRRTARGKPNDGTLDSLTGREREIADLVTGRRTNREIAAELVLGEKTVETHLHTIFRKLGTPSRRDLARLVDDAPAEA